MDFSEPEITETIDLMDETGISSLALSHCTGQRAIDILAAREDIEHLSFSPGMKYNINDNKLKLLVGQLLVGMHSFP